MHSNIFLGEIIIVFGAVIFCMIRAAMLGYAYDRYLRENHFEKWKKVTTIFGIGPGMANSYRAWKFLFSKDDLGDNELAIVKAKTRNAMVYVISCFVAAPLFLFMIITLTKN